MEHDIVPGCLHWRRATYEDWRLWTLIVRPLLFLAQVVSDSFVVAVTLSGGPKLHLNSYSTDDMIASGSLLLERFPLCFALSQELRSPAIILLLRKAEAALENTFALIGLLLQRVDML